MHDAGSAARSLVPLALAGGFRHLLALPDGLRQLLACMTPKDGARRLPRELAHLDDRLLRDIGFDPETARREIPLDPFVSTPWP